MPRRCACSRYSFCAKGTTEFAICSLYIFASSAFQSVLPIRAYARGIKFSNPSFLAILCLTFTSLSYISSSSTCLAAIQPHIAKFAFLRISLSVDCINGSMPERLCVSPSNSIFADAIRLPYSVESLFSSTKSSIISGAKVLRLTSCLSIKY